MKITPVLLILFVVLAQAAGTRAQSAPAAVRYTTMIMGKPAGALVATAEPGGEHRYEFEYNDRGRGPKLTTRVKLGPDGLPVLLETTGHDYLKAPVDERFSVAGGKAAWKNKGERAERAAAGAFYVSYDGSPAESGLLVRALLARPDRRLPLLPDGEARLEKVTDLEVAAGGKTRAVTLYAVIGPSLEPFYIWLGTDGAYFASVSEWFTTVLEGWEAAVPAMLERQTKVADERLGDVARRLSRRPKAPLAFTNARLFDAETAKVRPGMTVVITGNKITDVFADGERRLPEGAEVVDARGRTLMPGLWDMHTHLGPSDGLLNIAAGVTSVRDLANDTDMLLALRRKFDEGAIIGPRVVMAGFMDGRGPYAGPTKVFVDTEEEARAAIDRYASLGYEQIKVYSSIKPELVPVIVEEARKRKLRVSGHIPAFMTAEQAVRQGYDELQHINFVFLNFLFDTVQDTRTPARFTVPAEHAAGIDPASPRVREFIRLLKERGTVVDPTVNVFEGMFTDRPGTVSTGYVAVADRLPTLVRRGLLGGGLPVPEGKDARYRESFRAMLKMIAALHEAGVPIVAGTDAFSGFALHRELELYVEAGIPAPEVLRIATLGAARVAKRADRLGTIAPGKLADVILVDGDPTSRISDIRRVALVVKDGVVFEPDRLYATVGIRPAA